MNRVGYAKRALVFLKRTLGPLLLWGLVAFLFFGTLRHPPSGERDRTGTAAAHLLGLRHALRKDEAVSRMQRLYPEGGCFTLTLYGLSWVNLLSNFNPDPEMRRTALEEIEWALAQYRTPDVAGPFSDTGVEKGVFWLGQRNLVLGRYLGVLDAGDRTGRIEEEFHENSASLHRAFMGSKTAHLDSYPGLCWPADNVTALLSLTLHDRLYGTDYTSAFRKWKSWTTEHADPETGLPAGHLDSRTGELLQPARGCANSWILALIPEIDREYSAMLYGRYREHFLIKRFGFGVFREYPASVDLPADVDSGPVVLGGGATATGVGLAASFANGDERTAQDIHGIAATLGLRRSVTSAGRTGTRYLFGKLPVGDAFLTWAYTLERPGDLLKAASFSRLLRDRKTAVMILLLSTALSGYSIRRTIRGGGVKGEVPDERVN